MIPEQLQETVQKIPDAKQSLGADFWYGETTRGPLLSAWGTRRRERELRLWYRSNYNWMVQGAFSGIMKRIASTPWEITGPDTLTESRAKFYRRAYKVLQNQDITSNRPDVEYWQAVIRQADFGRGWTSFCQKGIDYLRQDAGWYWELIAPGDPMEAPTGPVIGIAHLDSLRCVPTGDPRYPVVYYSRSGQLRLMHHQRVVQIVDMPDGDEARPGYGLSALSRAIAIVSRQMNITRYVEQYVDDKPPPGIAMTNMSQQQRLTMIQKYHEEQATDAIPAFGRTMWMHVPGEMSRPTLEFINFSQAPEKFDFKTYTELDVDALALAIGVDKQELWQLTGGTLGSGAQSEIMQAKARGKTIGTLLTEIERSINDILPPDYTFKFKARDEQEELNQAQIAQTWAQAVQIASSNLEPDEIRYLLANKVDAFKDAMTDQNGQIRRVDDVDVQPDDTERDVILDGQENPNSNGVDGDTDNGRRQHAVKAIQATILDFENDFAAFISALQNEQLNSRRAGIVGRALLNRYGRRAYRDGLADGGVQVDTLADDDADAYASWLAEQSVYLRQFINRVLDGTEYNPASRAGMWANKSIRSTYHLGLLSADRNGMYEWVIGPTEKSCKDCVRLNGQVHRLKSYYERGLIPQSQQLACNGNNCKCRFQRTNERARGRF